MRTIQHDAQFMHSLRWAHHDSDVVNIATQADKIDDIWNLVTDGFSNIYQKLAVDEQDKRLPSDEKNGINDDGQNASIFG
jgi:hypothetical protein